MDLERVAVALRERDPWEATDLGFAMVRRWARPVFATWVAAVWPVAVLLHVALYEHPTVALVATWWLKPLYDRFVLAITSRAFFGETPRPRHVLLHLPSYIGRGLVGALTWRRLSPWRSFVLPVDQLERLTGAARRDRIRVLARDDAGSAMLLTGVAALFESFFALSLFALVAIFIEDAGGLDTLYQAVYGEESAAWAPFLVSGIYLLATSLVEPFYVAGGFALYINRRVHLEAWDIELRFRRLARRLAEAGRAAVALLALAAVLAAPAAARAEAETSGPGGATPSPAVAVVAPSAMAASDSAVATASAVEAVDSESAEVRAAVDEVLAHPDFETMRTEGSWRRIGAQEQESDTADVGWLRGFAQLLATLLKWLVLVAAAVAVGYVALAILRKVGPLRPQPERPRAPPETLFGLDIRPESLPEDVVAAARARFAAGDPTAALSLLYRGALAYLVGEQRLEIPPSATEGECVAMVGRDGEPALAGDFGALTRAWQQIAYARRPVPAPAFEDLCGRWAAHLRRAA